MEIFSKWVSTLFSRWEDNSTQSAQTLIVPSNCEQGNPCDMYCDAEKPFIAFRS